MIRYLGAAYLIYLGYKMWTADVETDFKQLNDKPVSWVSGFFQGFLISASNSKVILFYIAFLPIFIDLTILNNSDIFLILALNFLATTTSLLLVSFSASKVRTYLKSEKAVKRLNRTAGSLMISAGLFLASRGGHS